MSWLIINSIYLAKSVDRAAVEDATLAATSQLAPPAAIAPEFTAELAQLRTQVADLDTIREELARVSAKVGSAA